MMADFRALGMPQSLEQVRSDSQLAGKTFVITGSFDTPRREIEERLERLGAKVASSVSKKTDYVLVGEDAGSKREKAEALGIPLLDMDSFERLVENS